MPRSESHEMPPSDRSVQAVGRFIRFVGALDEGRLRQADREQAELRRLGFHVDVRPFGSPEAKGGVPS